MAIKIFILDFVYKENWETDFYHNLLSYKICMHMNILFAYFNDLSGVRYHSSIVAATDVTGENFLRDVVFYIV